MAATKIDPVAAKQAKQKKILIALSVVLVAVLAIQLPRMMGGGESTPAAASAGDESTTAGAAQPAAAVTETTPVPAPVSLQTAIGGAQPKAGQAQLASFSLFAPKDPFVQQIVVEKATEAEPGAAGGAASGKGGKGGVAAGNVSGGNGSVAQPTLVKLTNATISVNDEAEPVELKGTFPQEDPLFVLVSLKGKTAKIGIAGGELTNGKLATLRMDRPLTLVNDATGARYTLELLYTGTAAEQVEGFSSGSATEPAAATP